MVVRYLFLKYTKNFVLCLQTEISSFLELGKCYLDILIYIHSLLNLNYTNHMNFLSRMFLLFSNL